MASTNETSVLKLPQFVGTDKPSWIGDFNSAMEKIDTAVGENIGKISSVETVANSADATAKAAQSQVTAQGSEVARIAGEVDAQGSEIDSLQTDVENINNQIAGLSGIQLMEADGSDGTYLYARQMFTGAGGISMFLKMMVFLAMQRATSNSTLVGNMRVGSTDYPVLLCDSINGNIFNLNSVSMSAGQTASVNSLNSFKFMVRANTSNSLDPTTELRPCLGLIMYDRISATTKIMVVSYPGLPIGCIYYTPNPIVVDNQTWIQPTGTITFN